MKNLMFIFIIFIVGCTGKQSFEIPELKEAQPFEKSSNPSVRSITIKDFLTLDHDLNQIPDDIKIVINLLQPVPLATFFQMLIEQGVNIVSDLGVEDERMISMPSFNGILKDLLKSVQISHGLFFNYQNGVLICRTLSPAYVKVLMPGTQNSLIKLLNSFGVENSFYDELSSRIVFKTDFYTYKSIFDYFKNNGYLTLVYFDIMVLERAETKDFKHGIDWSGLAATIQDLTNNYANISSSGDGIFNLQLGSSFGSLQSVFLSLDELKNFNILQSARISALNGSTCSLDVSEKIPYVTSIKIGRLEGSNDQITQGYEFDQVSSGLVLSIKPSVSGNIISLLFNAKIQSVNDFLEIGSQNQLIKQPIVSTRNLKNQIVFRAGETALIGGLKYNKVGLTKSSLSWLKSGFKIHETRSFLVSILIKSEVVRYVFI